MPSKSNVARAAGTVVALSLATAVLASGQVHANSAQAGTPSAAAAVAAAAATADVERPQGKPGPLKTEEAGKNTFSGAPAAQSAPAPVTRSEVIARAKTWVDAQVPYSMSNYRNGYRTDCSGLVSMAWKLGTNAWTGNLDTYADRISKDELRKGDMLLFHNPDNPERGSHVTIFEGWTDSSRTSYVGIEQTPPHAVRRVIPYAYFKNSSSYIPYRYKNIIEDAKPTNAGVFRSEEAKFYVADRNGGLYGHATFGVPG
ncbi:NlpC/P60 family protein, partial [Streptomyces toxytricini]